MQRVQVGHYLLVALSAAVIGAQFSDPIGIYNSSHTPSNLPWNTYNYCNAPHVNPGHYSKPSQSAELVYMNVMMRHHKVVSILATNTLQNTYRGPM